MLLNVKCITSLSETVNKLHQTLLHEVEQCTYANFSLQQKLIKTDERGTLNKQKG